MKQELINAVLSSYNQIGQAGYGFDAAVLDAWNDGADTAEDEKSLVAAILNPVFTAIKSGETIQQTRCGEVSFDAFYYAFVDLVTDVKEYKAGARLAYKAVFGEKLNSGRLTTPDERADKRAKSAEKAAEKAAAEATATESGESIAPPVSAMVSLQQVNDAMAKAGATKELIEAVLLSLAV
jgi:hypothetical protein